MKKIFFSVLLDSKFEHMLEFIQLWQTNIYFREQQKKTYQKYCHTSGLQVFHKRCLCQFSLSFLGEWAGGRVRGVILGASKSSNRSPIFVKLIFKEVK